MAALRCCRYPAQPVYARVARSRAFGRLRVSAAESSNTNGQAEATSRTMRSLDSLLGSQDDDGVLTSTPSTQQRMPEAVSTDSQVLPIATTWNNLVLKPGQTAGIPKVQPIVCYVLYYLHIAVYAAVLSMGAFQGPEASDGLLGALVDDHLALEQGHQLYRLVTASFAHTSPQQLFVTLLALLTLGAELEAVMGYSAFLVLFLLSIMTATAAEAGADLLPITQGSSPAVASFVGGLLVHMAKNGTFDEDLESVQSGRVNEVRMHEVDVIEGMTVVGLLKLAVYATKDVRVSLTVLGTGVAAVQAVMDVAESDDQAVTWVGLAAGLGAGVLLALALVPRYIIRKETSPAACATLATTIASTSSQPASAAPSSGSTFVHSAASASNSNYASTPTSAAAPAEDACIAVIVEDSTSLAQRLVSVAGYSIALGGAVSFLLNAS